jgi:hypothetical protein
MVSTVCNSVNVLPTVDDRLTNAMYLMDGHALPERHQAVADSHQED